MFAVALFVAAGVNGQKMIYKSGSLLANDAFASNNPRQDASGTNCAVIRVGVVGVSDLLFPDAVGTVERSQSEYVVYVPGGLKALRYRNASGSIAGEVPFGEGRDITRIASNSSYRVVFDTDSHLRAAVFAVQPATAQLTFDGQRVTLDQDGMAVIEKPVGTYQYTVSAQGYDTQKGSVRLTQEEISAITNIDLDARMHTLAITSSPPDASLFVDGTPYGQVDKMGGGIELQEGTHKLKFIANGYDDYEQTLSVGPGSPGVNVAMTQKKLEVVKFNDERTRRKVNLPTGHYLTLGGCLYEKEKNLGQVWGASLSYSSIQHFGAIFAAREGIGLGMSFLNDSIAKETYGKELKDTTTFFVDVPLQVGFSFPFGAYNRHTFSVLAGGYGKYMYTKFDDDESKEKWDWGLRGTVIIEISRFNIGAEISQSLKGYGLTYGVTLGVRLNKNSFNK